MALKMPFIFNDHMVLQRDMPLRIWGWAPVGERVTAQLGGQIASAVTGVDGRWTLTLPAMPAGGPLELTVRAAGGATRTFTDVLIGEVWICSGQSNMEWPLANSIGAAEEIRSAADPQLRLTTISRQVAAEPREDCSGDAWTAATPESAMPFSAVAYHFGKRLRRTLNVPVGLIHTSWGGTPAEAWTTRGTLRNHPDLQVIEHDFARQVAQYPAALETYAALKRAYDEKYLHQDPGNRGEALGYARPDFDDAAWESMPIACTWESQGLDIDGAVWFRRAVDVPAAWAGRDLTLRLGAIDDFDTSYFNGVVVGSMGREVVNAWRTQRVYTVPGRLVKAGRNVIAVRVFDQFGAGGMCGPINELRVAPAGTEEGSIALSGRWQFKVELALPHHQSLPEPMPAEPIGADSHHSPAGLYNAMIHPLVGYAIRGAIWYQGETNAGRAVQYRTLLPAMIESWRGVWEQGRFPFLIVQLANYMERRPEPAASDWALLREAQTMTAALPGNGLAVAIDLGEAADIHPRNKRDVGLRLAYLAEHSVYDLPTPAHGPTFAKLSREAGALRVHFNHAAGGLKSNTAAVTGFAIAGADRQFHWASATIDGSSVLLRHPAAPDPIAVRYAWADNPECSLYNAAGLPAGPFRSDDW